VTAGTHLAGAVLTASLLRGFGLELDFPEACVCLLGSLLADVDTTTSGVGKFVKPLSSAIETRFGHRTVTHSLTFSLVLALALYPLLLWQPAAYWAFLWGYLSHLLLDTFNVNGVPLLWPVRVQFWFFPSRSLRIKYGSQTETYLAVFLLLSGLWLWFSSADGFDTGFRRLIASPETAVMDYLKMRDSSEVYAELTGFNSQTQEDMKGRFLIVEALGRSGVLVEDSSGRTFAVSKFGQVVAYRIRAYPGKAIQKAEYRVDLGGRTVGELLDSLPTAQHLHLSGLLELSSLPKLPPAPIGTLARVRKLPNRAVLELQAARPDDLKALERSFIVSGSAVVRAEYAVGTRVPGWTLKRPRAALVPHTVSITGLPSLAGLLVQRGDTVVAGQPLARRVDDLKLRALESGVVRKRREAQQVRGQAQRLESQYREQRDQLRGDLKLARGQEGNLRYLVTQDAEPRIKLEAASQAVRSLEEKDRTLLFSFTSAQTQLLERAQGLEVEAVTLETQRQAVMSRQLVKSPFAGEVGDVRVGAASSSGVNVEVVIVSKGP